MQEQNAEKMQEKRKRLAVALTIAGTMLLLFLIIILSIQFTKIGVANAERRRLDKEIDKYNEAIQNGNDQLEFYSSELGKYVRALELHWNPPQK